MPFWGVFRIGIMLLPGGGESRALTADPILY